MSEKPIDRVLSRLPSAKQTGDRKWQAKCPSHDDKSPSLSITERNGTVLLFCHAGCSVEKVMQALGLQTRDLFSDTKKSRTEKTLGEIVATYHYRDKSENLLFEVVRFEPKDFRQRRLDPANPGGWLWDLDGVQRVLYRLPELLKADPADWVVVVEGEKDTDNLRALGLTATCNSGGAGKWHLTDDSPLTGRRVAILPDSDAPGHKHAQQVATALYGKAAEVRIVPVPEGHKDASDWIEAQDSQTADELREASLSQIEAAPMWTPQASQPLETQPKLAKSETPLLSVDEFQGLSHDMLNGAHFAAKYSDRVKYCGDREEWLTWDGARWLWDRTHQTERLFQDLAKEKLIESAQIIGGVREATVRHWLSSMRMSRVSAALLAARSDPRLIVRLKNLDAIPLIINCLNGTLNLETGILSPHDPAQLLTMLAPVEFNPEADQTEWLQFLNRILPDQDMRNFLRRAVGYSIAGKPDQLAVFFVWGPTGSGKSTTMAAISASLGEYAATAAFESFLKQHNIGGPRPDIVRLAGRRFVSSIETEEGSTLAEGIIKLHSGGDMIAVRGLYEKEQEFLPTYTFWLVANYLPKAPVGDDAFWIRLQLIPFDVSILKADQKAQVKERLRNTSLNGAAILSWAVEGYQEYKVKGLDYPKKIRQATLAWRMENDPIGDWFTERCREEPGAEVTFADLFKNYSLWCDTEAVKRISRKAFGSRLQGRGYKIVREGAGNRQRFYAGIRLISIANKSSDYEEQGE